MVYMAIFDIPQWDLAVLHGGNTFKVYHVRRDQKMIDTMLLTGKHFYDTYVVGRKEPPTGNPYSVEAYLNAAYKQREDRIINSDHETECIAEDYRARLAMYQEAEEKLIEVKNKLKRKVGENSGIQGDDFYITWRPNRVGTRVFNFRDFRKHD